MEAATEILVPATPEEAWEAITDPEQLGEWLGDEVEIEPSPGGELTVRSGDEQRCGFVEEVEAPRRLVFWWSVDEAEASRVEIELTGDDHGTRVQVTESHPLAVLDLRGIELETRLGGGASPQMSTAPALPAG